MFTWLIEFFFRPSGGSGVVSIGPFRTVAAMYHEPGAVQSQYDEPGAVAHFHHEPGALASQFDEPGAVAGTYHGPGGLSGGGYL